MRLVDSFPGCPVLLPENPGLTSHDLNWGLLVRRPIGESGPQALLDNPVQAHGQARLLRHWNPCSVAENARPLSHHVDCSLLKPLVSRTGLTPCVSTIDTAAALTIRPDSEELIFCAPWGLARQKIKHTGSIPAK